MSKSCLSCSHKDVCIKRGLFVFQMFIQTGRYGEVEEAQKKLDIGVGCENWEEQLGRAEEPVIPVLSYGTEARERHRRDSETG